MGLGDKIRELDKNEVFDKLEGLRGALMRMFIIIAALSIVSYFFWKEALHFLRKPLGLPLIIFNLPEGFFTSLRLALFMGTFLAMPFIFNGLWSAFAPLFAFGVIFELPLILLILGRVGWIGYRGLAKNRKYAFLFNSIFSALLTPTPDAYTMLLMMAPIQILYELSIWLVKFFGKEK